jgi:hypothetical protein
MCPPEPPEAQAVSRYGLQSARRTKRGVTKLHLMRMLTGRDYKCLKERCGRSGAGARPDA